MLEMRNMADKKPWFYLTMFLLRSNVFIGTTIKWKIKGNVYTDAVVFKITIKMIFGNVIKKSILIKQR